MLTVLKNIINKFKRVESSRSEGLKGTYTDGDIVIYRVDETGINTVDSGIHINNIYRPNKPTTLIDTTGTTYNFFAGTNAGTNAGIGTAKNVGIGIDSLTNLNSGSGNVVVGQNSGHIQTNYNACVFLGANTDANVNNLTNAIAIGYNVKVEMNNSMVLGRDVNVGIGTSKPYARLHVIGGQIVNYTAVATNYTILTTDYIIAVTDTLATRTIKVPSATMINKGQVYIVKDESGKASVRNIVITVDGGGTINGANSVVISMNYGVAHLYSNGRQWFTMNGIFSDN